MSTFFGTSKNEGGINTSDPITFTSRLNSLALGKGAFVVEGGASIQRNVNIGGSLKVNGDMLINEASVVDMTVDDIIPRTSQIGVLFQNKDHTNAKIDCG